MVHIGDLPKNAYIPKQTLKAAEGKAIDTKVAKAQPVRAGFSGVKKGAGELRSQFKRTFSTSEWSVAGSLAKTVKDTWHAIRGVKAEGVKTEFTAQEASSIKMGLQQLKDNPELKPQVKNGVFSVVEGNPNEMTAAEKKAVGKYLAAFAAYSIKNNQFSPLTNEIAKLIQQGKGNSSEAMLLREMIEKGVGDSENLQKLREMHRKGNGDKPDAITLKNNIITEASIHPFEISKTRELEDLFTAVPYLDESGDYEIALGNLQRENRIEAKLEGKDNPFDVKIHELKTALIQIKNDPYLQLGVVVDEKGKPVLDKEGNATFQAVRRTIGGHQNQLVEQHLSHFADTVIKRDLHEQAHNHMDNLSTILKDFRKETSWGDDFFTHNRPLQRSLGKLERYSEVAQILGKKPGQTFTTKTEVNFRNQVTNLLLKSKNLDVLDHALFEDITHLAADINHLDYRDEKAVAGVRDQLNNLAGRVDALQDKLLLNYKQVAELELKADQLEQEVHDYKPSGTSDARARADKLFAEANEKFKLADEYQNDAEIKKRDAMILNASGLPQDSDSLWRQANRLEEDATRNREQALAAKKQAQQLLVKDERASQAQNTEMKQKLDEAKALREKAALLKKETDTQFPPLRELSEFMRNLSTDIYQSTFSAKLEKAIKKAGFSDMEAVQKFASDAQTKIKDGEKLLQSDKEAGEALIKKGNQELQRAARILSLQTTHRVEELEESGVTASTPFTYEEGHKAVTRQKLNQFKRVMNFVILSQSQEENIAKGQGSVPFFHPGRGDIQASSADIGYMFKRRVPTNRMINDIWEMTDRVLKGKDDLQRREIMETFELLKNDPHWGQKFMQNPLMKRLDNRLRIVEDYKNLMDSKSYDITAINSFIGLLAKNENANDPGVTQMLQDLMVSAMTQSPRNAAKAFFTIDLMSSLVSARTSLNRSVTDRDKVSGPYEKQTQEIKKQTQLMKAIYDIENSTHKFETEDANIYSFLRLMSELKDTPLVKGLIKDKGIRDLVNNTINSHKQDDDLQALKDKTLANRMSFEDTLRGRYDDFPHFKDLIVEHLNKGSDDPGTVQILLDKARVVIEGPGRKLTPVLMKAVNESNSKALMPFKRDFQMLSLYDKIKNDPTASDEDKKAFMKLLSGLSNDKPEDRIYINNRMLLSLNQDLIEAGFKGGIQKHTDEEEF